MTRHLVIALLLLHSTMLAWMGARNSPTMDEPAHLPAGVVHWKTGCFDLYRVNPPLIRTLAALPAVISGAQLDVPDIKQNRYYRGEWFAGKAFLAANGPHSFTYFTLARWSCIPISLLGAWICWRWSQKLYGPTAGLLTLTLWCFSPNILAWGSTINPDLGAASFGVAAGFYFWQWLESPKWSNTLTAGCWLGLALLTKTTWIVLFGLWPVLWVISLRLSRHYTRRETQPSLRQLLVILVQALYIVNVGYGFERTGIPLGEYQFISHTLGGPGAHSTPANRFSGSWLGVVPILLPENYVCGIDMQKYEFEKRKWSYLRGEQKLGGWWYYYLYCMAVKIPLGTWALGIGALCLTIRGWPNSQRLRAELMLLAPAVLVLLLVSSQTGFSRHFRYVIPAFPFLLVWAGKCATLASDIHPVATRACWAFVLWTVASSLSVYPYSLSYFNELAGGPKGGHAHLLDSNIDWGQDLFSLKRWIDAHPEASSIRIASFGFCNPSDVGIDAETPPSGPIDSDDLQVPPASEIGPLPGWYAVSVNHIRGYRHFDFNKPTYVYFCRFRPVAMAGYSIYIYHITADEANKVRAELGLPLIL